VHLLFHVVAMANPRESSLALGRRPSTLVFVGLIVYLSRTMDVNHCGPPGTVPLHTSRSVCVVHQRKTRAGSGHRRRPIEYTHGTKQGPVSRRCYNIVAEGYSFLLSSCSLRQVFTPDCYVPVAARTGLNRLLSYAGILRFCG
jgi:hypothetical protein